MGNTGQTQWSRFYHPIAFSIDRQFDAHLDSFASPKAEIWIEMKKALFKTFAIF